MPTRKGTCFCGAIAIEAEGEPFSMGYCHCADCRSYSGSPVSTFTLWQPDQVRVAQGADYLSGFNKTGFSDRRFCRQCGGHVLSYHPTAGFTDVHASSLPTLAFQPQMHINYAATVLPMRDGLPKLRDFPAEAGGSGEMVAD